MTAPFIDYDCQDGIVVLTMNRPEQRNALSDTAQMLEFVTVCQRASADPAVRLVILTGAGTAFSAGGNIKHMRDKRAFAAGSPLDIRNSYLAGIAQVPLALDVVNPATGEVINQLPLASRDDVARAIAAASRAFET